MIPSFIYLNNRFLKNFLILSVPIISALLLFRDSLSYYFFQDDWFVLNSVNTSLAQFLSLLYFRTDVIYFRPIGMELFFAISKSLFGLNVLSYHLVVFTFHLANSLLVGYLIYQLFKNRLSSFVSTFIYATASFHFMTLSWLSLTWNAIGSTFYLLTLIFLITSIKISKKLYLFLSAIFFVICLATTEFAVTFPLIAFALIIFKPSQVFREIKLKTTLSYLTVIWAITIFYLILRIFIYPAPTAGDYSLNFNFAVAKNLFWYFLWQLNLPESFRHQLILSKLYVTPNLKNAIGNELYLVFLSFSAQIIALIYLLIKGLGNNLVKSLGLFSIVFTVGLLPVLLIPQHSYPYYLSVSSLGFLILISSAISRSDKRVVPIVIFIVFWIISSYLAIDVAKKTHWIVSEQRISKEVIDKSKLVYPQIVKGSLVVFPANDQLMISLMDQNAFQVLYSTKEINTFYLSEGKVLGIKTKEGFEKSRQSTDTYYLDIEK